MKRRLHVYSLLLMASLSLLAQLPAGMPQPVFLWPHGAPDALGQDEADKPRLYAFLPPTRSTMRSTA